MWSHPHQRSNQKWKGIDSSLNRNVAFTCQLMLDKMCERQVGLHVRERSNVTTTVCTVKVTTTASYLVSTCCLQVDLTNKYARGTVSLSGVIYPPAFFLFPQPWRSNKTDQQKIVLKAEHLFYFGHSDLTHLNYFTVLTFYSDSSAYMYSICALSTWNTTKM